VTCPRLAQHVRFVRLWKHPNHFHFNQMPFDENTFTDADIRLVGKRLEDLMPGSALEFQQNKRNWSLLASLVLFILPSLEGVVFPFLGYVSDSWQYAIHLITRLNLDGPMPPHPLKALRSIWAGAECSPVEIENLYTSQTTIRH
jgi:hypothetical protein